MGFFDWFFGDSNDEDSSSDNDPNEAAYARSGSSSDSDSGSDSRDEPPSRRDWESYSSFKQGLTNMSAREYEKAVMKYAKDHRL